MNRSPGTIQTLATLVRSRNFEVHVQVHEVVPKANKAGGHEFGEQVVQAEDFHERGEHKYIHKQSRAADTNEVEIAGFEAPVRFIKDKVTVKAVAEGGAGDKRDDRGEEVIEANELGENKEQRHVEHGRARADGHVAEKSFSGSPGEHELILSQKN